MALPIQSPPTLTGESARKFIETADLAYQNRGTVDMSREMEIMKAILKKAKLR